MGLATATALATGGGIVCGGATGFVAYYIARNPSGTKETDLQTAIGVGLAIGSMVGVPAAAAGFAVGMILPYTP